MLCCAVGAFVLRSVTTPQKVFLTAAHKLIATILHACCAHDPDARPLASAGSPGIAAYDEKNIRRRVYDALNVLMAMDIIVKDKKDISWQGLPSAPHAQLEKLKEERAALRQKILNQQAYLQVCQSLKPCTAMINMLTSPGADHVGLLMGASSQAPQPNGIIYMLRGLARLSEVQRRPAALHGLCDGVQVMSQRSQECALCHVRSAEGAESLRVPVCRRPASSTGHTGICCCGMQTSPPACWPRLRARVRGPRP